MQILLEFKQYFPPFCRLPDSSFRSSLVCPNKETLAHPAQYFPQLLIFSSKHKLWQETMPYSYPLFVASSRSPVIFSFLLYHQRTSLLKSSSKLLKNYSNTSSVSLYFPFFFFFFFCVFPVESMRYRYNQFEDKSI